MFERAAILFVPFLAFLAEHAFLRSLVMTTLMGLGVYLLCALVGITAEMSQRHDMSVYRTRNSLNDLAYVCEAVRVIAIERIAWIRLPKRNRAQE